VSPLTQRQSKRSPADSSTPSDMRTFGVTTVVPAAWPSATREKS
jgi:hypothetical protein